MILRLFTKTYKNDYPWLELALKSVIKLCVEAVDWTIVGDNGSRAEIEAIVHKAVAEKGGALKYQIFEVEEHWPECSQVPNGYLSQQWVKMNAHRVMGNDLFWNWDSDVIAVRHFSSDAFIGESRRPIYWFSQFNSIMSGADRPAHEARISMLKEVLDVREAPFEFMRCMPIPLFGQILKCGSERREWQKSFELLRNADARFSEFNIIGQFAQLFFPDAYEWTNAEAAGPTWSGGYMEREGKLEFQEHAFVSQGWSWGGVPEKLPEFVNAL